MTGRVRVIGIGPGSNALVTPEAAAALAEITDVIGYVPYVERIADRSGLTVHASDNGNEISRANLALELAEGGADVGIVSSGDPGVFAMAAALFEALGARPSEVLIDVLPGITAMLAAAARLGAPLGHDFCAINLSDNLKPWAEVERRLTHAARGGFAMALYNPRSKSRPHGFGKALDLLRAEAGVGTLISFARNVSRPDERLRTVTLAEATEDMADMRTVVIVGTALTRRVGPWIYTPRSA